MNVAPVSSTLERAEAYSTDHLHGLCECASDPESEIETLLLKNSQHQKATASRLQNAYMKEKTSTLEKAFGKMQEAGNWKIGGSLLNIVLKVAATVVANYAGDKAGLSAKALGAALDATGNNNVLGYKVDECNLAAEQKRSGAQIMGMRSADHAQWIKDTRSMEIKMLDHLQSLDAKRHEEKKAIIST